MFFTYIILRVTKIVTRTVKARAHRFLLHISPLKHILKNESYPFCKKFLPNMNRAMNVVRENTKKLMVILTLH